MLIGHGIVILWGILFGYAVISCPVEAAFHYLPQESQQHLECGGDVWVFWLGVVAASALATYTRAATPHVARQHDGMLITVHNSSTSLRGHCSCGVKRVVCGVSVPSNQMTWHGSCV